MSQETFEVSFYTNLKKKDTYKYFTIIPKKFLKDHFPEVSTERTGN